MTSQDVQSIQDAQGESPQSLPITTMDIELEGKYEGWVAKCDADPPFGLITALESGDPTRLAAAIVGRYRPDRSSSNHDSQDDQDDQDDPPLIHTPGFVLEWNFKDRDGNPLDPVPEDLDFVPSRAIQQLLTKYGRSFRELPNAPVASSSPTLRTVPSPNRAARRHR